MFNLFKQKPKVIEVYSPLDGEILPLDASPDEAFAQGMLGEGICIEPSGNMVHSPFNGEVEIFHTLHAVGCKTNGVEMIVHVGMNTVNLKGEGFKALAPLEGSVKLQAPLIEFDRDYLRTHVSTLITPFIVVNKPDNATLEIIKTEGPVKVGDLLMKIHL